MNIRDEIAAQAMAAMINSTWETCIKATIELKDLDPGLMLKQAMEENARNAYIMADTMLRAREVVEE